MRASIESALTRVSVPSSAVLVALTLFCSGCSQHRISVVSGYRIDNSIGQPLLVPTGAPSKSSENLQTVTVMLSRSPSENTTPIPHDCAIHATAFSMQPQPGSDRRYWIVQSPSIAGWDNLSGEVNIDAQWTLFVRELARMHDRGCFPSGIDTQLVRSEVTRSIALPTNEVDLYMYSDQGKRFVDLAPGMEITIQKVLAGGPSVDAGSGGTPLRMLNAVYDVVALHNGDVSIRRSGGDHGQRGVPAEDTQLLTLNQKFAGTQALRLFLQGISAGETGQSQSRAILIGAPSATQLDVLTDLIRKKDPLSCAPLPGTVCVDLPSDSLSLFSWIRVNGRRTAWPFGASVASLLFGLPQPEQVRALASLEVARQLSQDHYAKIEGILTMEDANQLALLPGDSVRWDKASSGHAPR